ncbi:hypothetical protein [Ureibacillus sinduriensis]|uniref:hypothetical protein n=1 Tax=Ureibacillus sinduriensis TaxID=561440 RepID=UPI001BFFF88F|nr:hypothetical protein [Ureibacillus sinduriensis]
MKWVFCAPENPHLNFYSKNIATIVVTTRPMTTGTKFLRASSKGLTLQMAAAGMSAQGTSVPP